MKKNHFQKPRPLIRFRILIILTCLTNVGFSQVNNKQILVKLIHKIDSLNDFRCLCLRKSGDRSSLSYSYFYKNTKDTTVGYSFVLNDDFGAKSIYSQDKLLVINLQLKYFHTHKLESNPSGLVLLKSMYSSPITIKTLLIECLNSNIPNYKVLTNSKGQYEISLTLPNWIRDGYQFENITMEEKMQSTINIRFDKFSQLPISYVKKITSSNQSMAFIDSFYNYNPIKNSVVNVMDSIPAGFNYAHEKTIKKESIGMQSHNFKLKRLKGDSIELNRIDKYVLLDFTSLHCGACIAATKYLVESYDSFPNDLVEIIAIDIENKSQIDKLEKYISTEKIQFPYLINGNDAFSAYKGFATPTFVLINKEKAILDIQIGFDKDKFSEMMKMIK